MLHSIEHGIRIGCLVVLLCSCMDVCAQRPFTVMSWNVENAFDTVPDLVADDHEFLPDSPRRWNTRRYWDKVREMSRTITCSCDGGVPDLIGLCEVENDTVVRDLVEHSMLRDFGYRYVITASADPRGIDVALLYNPASFKLLFSENIVLPATEPTLPPTRDILYAKGLVNVYPTATDGLPLPAMDTMHVFVVHLPSRLGGMPAHRRRRKAVAMLWDKVNDIMAREGNKARVVVMGDFNTIASDRLFRHSPLSVADPVISKADRRKGNPAGTYRYRGVWQCIDHILISPALDDGQSATLVTLPWLLEPNTSRGGVQPRRTYLGTAYHGGISDHLPLLLQMQLTY